MSEIDGEYVKIRLGDVIDGMSREDKLALIAELRCDDEVIKAAVDQLLTGWTTDVSAGDSRTLHDQRMRLLKFSGETAARVVRYLQDQLSAAEHARRSAEYRLAEYQRQNPRAPYVACNLPLRQRPTMEGAREDLGLSPDEPEGIED